MATAASKMNRAYWRKRAVRQAEQQMKADEEMNLGLKREYERILHELDAELAAFYARYAENEGASYAAARKLLRDAELEDFRMTLDEFREKAIAGGYDKELNEIYLRTRVSRLQALQTQIELRMQELFQDQQELLHDHLAGIYTDTYYQTVYAVSQQMPVLASFARIDTDTVEKLLSKPWLGSDFSSRIWADKDKLTRELMQTLSRGFVRGDSLDRMTKEFAQRMGVSQSRAATLIHTESAHAAAEATAWKSCSSTREPRLKRRIEMATRKKTEPRTSAAPAFTKEQLLAFSRYRERRDLLGVLLKDGQRYTFSEVDALVGDFMKGKVNE